MKTNILLLAAVFFFTSFLQAQQDFGSEEEANPYEFAFQINTGSAGQAIRCAVIYTNPYGKEKVNYMPLDQWVQQFLGYQQSKANPEGENYVEKYNIFKVPNSVKAKGEEEVKIYSKERTEAIMKNMWRLRYSQYPFGKGSKELGKGWAAHPDSNIYFMPSQGQFQILESYGIKTMNDLFRGEDAFRLMRDILDKNWQKKYASGSDPLGFE